MSDLFVFIAAFSLLFLFARWFVGAGVGAPYVPIRRRDIADAFALVGIGADDVVVDLGSGDGRLLIAAAARGARVIGYEINPLLVCVSRLRLRRFGDRATVYNKDLRHAHLADATVIFIFGITELMPVVAHLIRQRTRNGTRVVSFGFALPGFDAVAERGIARAYVTSA